MSTRIDVVVIGGGIIGLAIAQALSSRGRDVVVLEKHNTLGSETSARNSEVIHAGIYGQPGSRRARFCVTGKQRLYRFCHDHSIATRQCGKLIVAHSESEMDALKVLIARGKANGVTDLHYLTSQQASDLEPDLTCYAACLSPSTGVIDSHALLQALEARLLDSNGTIALRTTVGKIVPNSAGILIEIETENGQAERIQSSVAINAAGLMASQLSETISFTNGYKPPKTYLAKGHYFSYAGDVPFQRLIYPMPNQAGLGIHLTLDISGQAKFGPDVSWTEKATYDFEDDDGERHKNFATAIQRYWPGLQPDRLHPGYTGLRPKLSSYGQPAADFAIHTQADHGVPGFLALYGIESPGLTACLALADFVAEKACRFS